MEHTLNLRLIYTAKAEYHIFKDDFFMFKFIQPCRSIHAFLKLQYGSILKLNPPTYESSHCGKNAVSMYALIYFKLDTIYVSFSIQ